MSVDLQAHIDDRFELQVEADVEVEVQGGMKVELVTDCDGSFEIEVVADIRLN